MLTNIQKTNVSKTKHSGKENTNNIKMSYFCSFKTGTLIYLCCLFTLTQGNFPDTSKCNGVIHFNQITSLRIEGEKLFKVLLPAEDLSDQPVILTIKTAFQVNKMQLVLNSSLLKEM